MYKVFINDSSLEFVEINTAGGKSYRWKSGDKLEAWIDKLEAEELIEHHTIACENPERLWKQFMDLYQLIEAAGGVVQNQQKEILMIYRLDKWDLPKGKLEAGETIEEGAIREVEEECGIPQLEILKTLPVTYHTYRLKGERILKRTYWFVMQTEHRGELVPQIEEHIARAQWINPDFLNEYLGNTYASIRWLLEQTSLTN